MFTGENGYSIFVIVSSGITTTNHVELRNGQLYKKSSSKMNPFNMTVILFDV